MIQAIEELRKVCGGLVECSGTFKNLVKNKEDLMRQTHKIAVKKDVLR